jgi:hypothetical protein
MGPDRFRLDPLRAPEKRFFGDRSAAAWGPTSSPHADLRRLRNVFHDHETKRLAQRLSKAATAVSTGYAKVSIADSREAFISGMSVVARDAKGARALLQDFVALGHATIDEARSLILEARALEAIFRGSLKTARSRARAAAAR